MKLITLIKVSINFFTIKFNTSNFSTYWYNSNSNITITINYSKLDLQRVITVIRLPTTSSPINHHHLIYHSHNNPTQKLLYYAPMTQFIN